MLREGARRAEGVADYLEAIIEDLVGRGKDRRLSRLSRPLSWQPGRRGCSFGDRKRKTDQRRFTEKED